MHNKPINIKFYSKLKTKTIKLLFMYNLMKLGVLTSPRSKTRGRIKKKCLYTKPQLIAKPVRGITYVKKKLFRVLKTLFRRTQRFTSNGNVLLNGSLRFPLFPLFRNSSMITRYHSSCLAECVFLQKWKRLCTLQWRRKNHLTLKHVFFFCFILYLSNRHSRSVRVT